MTERSGHRRPATFKLDDPHVVVMDPDDAPGRPARGTVQVTPEADPALLPVPVEEVAVPARKGFRWGALFWSALGGLVVLGLGLGVTRLIEDLFARSESLGVLGLALALLVALALVVIVARESLALARLATIEQLHRRAVDVLRSDDRAQSRAILQDLLTLAHHNPQLARARTALQGHADDIIDGADLIRLAERELMTPLDQEARRLVSSAAQRVSLVTAVSPRAAIDVLFVFAGLAAAGAATGAALWRQAGDARADQTDAPRHRPSRHHRRHGGERQPDPAGARPWPCSQTVATAGRRRAQRIAHRATRARRHRRHPPAAVHRAAASRAWRSRQGSVAQARRRGVIHAGAGDAFGTSRNAAAATTQAAPASRKAGP